VTDEIKAALRNIAMLILSVGFLGVGMLKLIAFPAMVTAFEQWQLPSWSMYIIGVIELAIAVSLFYQPWRSKAIMAAFALMIGAISVHLIAGQFSQLYGPLVVLLFAGLLRFTEA